MCYKPNEQGRMATLVSKSLVAISHDRIEETDVEHKIVKIIPKKKSKRSSRFIVNAYNTPKQRKAKFKELFQGARKLAKDNALIILGDFNARNEIWGYRTIDAKGKAIAEAAEIAECELLTDPDSPTRTGNSFNNDTSPDLTYTCGTELAQWENLMENLGSDHYIIKTQISSDRLKHQLGTTKITDWDAFRKACHKLEKKGMQSIEDWAKMLKGKQNHFTKEVAKTTQTSEVDTRLLGLWEARRRLTKRWKYQKYQQEIETKLRRLR